MNKSSLIVEYDNGIPLEDIKTKNYFSPECDIDNVDVLLLPYEHFRGGYNILFSEYATEILRYLNNTKQIKADAPCSDEDFKEIELHDAVIDLGIFLLSGVVLPIFLNLISSFLYDKIKNKGEDANKVEAKIVINANKDNTN